MLSVLDIVGTNARLWRGVNYGVHTMIKVVGAVRRVCVGSDQRGQHQDERQRYSKKPLCNAISSASLHQCPNLLRVDTDMLCSTAKIK